MEYYKYVCVCVGGWKMHVHLNQARKNAFMYVYTKKVTEDSWVVSNCKFHMESDDKFTSKSNTNISQLKKQGRNLKPYNSYNPKF